MLKRISYLSTRYPRRVLGFWVFLLVLSLPLVSRVGSVLTTETGWAPDSQAKLTRDIVQAEFAAQTNYQLIIAAEAATSEISAATLSADLENLADDLRALPEVSSVETSASQELIPNFETGGSSLALLELSVTGRDAVDAATTRVKAALPQSGSSRYFLTGGPAVEQEIQAISKRDAFRAEVVGLSISLVVLTFVFGAVVAAALPLLVAVTSIAFSLAALYLAGLFAPVASFGITVVSLLGLATGIDYALLMVNRFREELGEEPPKGKRRKAHEKELEATIKAVERTVLGAGKAVSVSGLTTLIALSALLIPPLDFIRSMGLACLIVMFFSVMVSVTALPALLTLLGRRVNWLRVTGQEPGTRTRAFWRRRAETVMRRPWLWTLLGIAALSIMTLPALRMQTNISGVQGLTERTSAKRAQGVLESLNLDSLQASVDVLVDLGERGFYYPSSVRSLSSLTRDTQDLDNVAQLLSPLTAGSVPGLLLYQYYATRESALDSPLAELAQATVSEDGRYALLRVFPEADADPAAIATLIQTLETLSGELELSTIIGGLHVSDYEWTRALYGSFPYAVALVYLSTFILLGLAFRSVLIPLKSILLNTLGVGAAFGVITAVFQMGWLAPLFGLTQGLGFVETSIPIFIFAIVFGLSMDYEVFLVSRIYEGHQQGMSDREAVSHALSVTGSIISSAALLMIIVFAAFIPSNVVLIKTLALGLTVAVFLDATLIRSALVPAVMTLAGRWNWWLPEPFAKLAKRVNLSHD